jgi:hypothetical protein
VHLSCLKPFGTLLILPILEEGWWQANRQTLFLSDTLGFGLLAQGQTPAAPAVNA